MTTRRIMAGAISAHRAPPRRKTQARGTPSAAASNLRKQHMKKTMPLPMLPGAAEAEPEPTARHKPKEFVMNPSRHIRRLAAVLAGMASALLAFAAAAPAALAGPTTRSRSLGLNRDLRKKGSNDMIRIRHRVLLTALLTAVLGVLTPIPASFAAQQVTQSLTPPPPPFLTCKAVGNGTICQGSRSFTIDPHPDFACGNGVVIYDQGTVRQVATRYYNTDGNLTKRVIHEFWSDTQKSNPLTGATAPYSQASNITDVLSVPGDFSSATETVTGQGNITIPGMGAVLLNAGRTVMAPDGSIDFRAGPQDFLDYSLGNTDVVNELCAALGAN